MKKVVAALALVASLAVHADPTPIFVENFDSGLGAFSAINASSSPSGSGWFPGNAGVFTAQSGAPGAYAAANFLASNSGSIAAWLLSPELQFIGQTVSFFARTEDSTLGYFDSITLLVSTNGASTNLADFSPLLTIASGTMADSWTYYTALLGSIGTGRIAFLYSVADVNDANYVGLDTVSVTGGGIKQVPEPPSLALFGLGLGLVGYMLRRRNRRT